MYGNGGHHDYGSFSSDSGSLCSTEYDRVYEYGSSDGNTRRRINSIYV